MADKKKDNAGLAAGAAATGGGGLLLVRRIKRDQHGHRKQRRAYTPGSKLAEELGGQLTGRKWTGKLSSFLNGPTIRRAVTKFASETENINENMEIRRKVFSLGENGEDISTNESEKLFSTDNDELDDILEEVYYSGLEDGYDYAYQEKLYAEDESESATGIATAGGLAAAGTYGIGKLRSNRVIKKGIAEADERASKYFENAEKEAFKNSKGGTLSRKVTKKLNAAKIEAENISRAGRAEAEARAKSIGKKSKIGAAAVLTAGGLLATGKALKNRNKKSE